MLGHLGQGVLVPLLLGGPVNTRHPRVATLGLADALDLLDDVLSGVDLGLDLGLDLADDVADQGLHEVREVLRHTILELKPGKKTKTKENTR